MPVSPPNMVYVIATAKNPYIHVNNFVTCDYWLIMCSKMV